MKIQLLSFISFAFLLFSCSKKVRKCEISLNPEDAYTYPVLPGTEEWADLNSGEEMLEATQIDKNTLQKMSTDGLLVSWQDMPMKEAVYANSLTFYINKMAQLSNLLVEINARDDAGCKALLFYDAVDITEKIGIIDYLHIVALTASKPILEKLTNKQLKRLLETGLDHHDKKLLDPHFYGKGSVSYSLWVCARVMWFQNYKPFIKDVENSILLQDFIETGWSKFLIYSEDPDYKSILENSIKFLN